MTGFQAKQGELFCDGVRVAEIAAAEGTPSHIYSAALIRERYRALDSAFAAHPHRLHYAIKANSTTGIVRLLRSLGARADANSLGEMEVALRAGFAPADIVFTGVGKTASELERAIGLEVAAINAESPGEVGRIAALAAAQGVVANVAVRVNPDVDAGSHPHISTGRLVTKFGMSIQDAASMLRDMSRRPTLRIVGLHVHIGSQITRTQPIADAVRAITGLARQLAAEGINIQYLDIGGGLGIAYERDQPVIPVRDHAATVLDIVTDTPFEIVLEPGRWIVGPAGGLITRIVDIKAKPGGAFVVVDAGMTDLVRPALYGAWHAIEPVAPREGPPMTVDIVGPVCETSDTLGHNRSLPPVEVGDLLVVRDTGAYGAVMASNYNRRPTAAEILVEEQSWRLIRRRQTIDDMLQWDL